MNGAIRVARASVPDRLTPGDETLITEASALYPNFTALDLTRETLAEITRESGIDRATAFFYARLCEAPELQHFLEAVVASAAPDYPCHPLPSPAPKLLFVPGALYREFPSYRGDGRDFIAAAARLGMESEMIPVGSLAGLDENAEIIARALDRQTNPRLIVATVSKGGADLRYALESGVIPEGRIKAWLQVGGVLRGTPLASSIIHGNWFHRTIMHGYFRARGGSHRVFSDLAHDDSGMLAAVPQKPAGVGTVNVVGFPLTRHLAGSSLRRHARLAPLGPNDAMTLLADAILRPGLVWPLWGTNHFFQIPNLQGLVERVLAYICRHVLSQSSLPRRDSVSDSSLAAFS